MRSLRWLALVPFAVRFADGDIVIRAKDPRCATPGPDEGHLRATSGQCTNLNQAGMASTTKARRHRDRTEPTSDRCFRGIRCASVVILCRISRERQTCRRSGSHVVARRRSCSRKLGWARASLSPDSLFKLRSAAPHSVPRFARPAWLVTRRGAATDVLESAAFGCDRRRSRQAKHSPHPRR